MTGAEDLQVLHVNPDRLRVASGDRSRRDSPIRISEAERQAGEMPACSSASRGGALPPSPCSRPLRALRVAARRLRCRFAPLTRTARVGRGDVRRDGRRPCAFDRAPPAGVEQKASKRGVPWFGRKDGPFLRPGLPIGRPEAQRRSKAPPAGGGTGRFFRLREKIPELLFDRSEQFDAELQLGWLKPANSGRS
jgi:hypothetical protein